MSRWTRFGKLDVSNDTNSGEVEMTADYYNYNDEPDWHYVNLSVDEALGLANHLIELVNKIKENKNGG